MRTSFKRYVTCCYGALSVDRAGLALLVDFLIRPNEGSELTGH